MLGDKANLHICYKPLLNWACEANFLFFLPTVVPQQQVKLTHCFLLDRLSVTELDFPCDLVLSAVVCLLVALMKS